MRHRWKVKWQKRDFTFKGKIKAYLHADRNDIGEGNSDDTGEKSYLT